MPENNEAPPVVIPANAAVTDTLMAAFRMLTIVLTSIPILLTFLGKRDFISAIAYLQSVDGAAFIGAVTGLGAIGWGLWKTLHRVRQAVSVAADPRTPDAVSSLK